MEKEIRWEITQDYKPSDIIKVEYSWYHQLYKITINDTEIIVCEEQLSKLKRYFVECAKG